jgi:5'-nucleotidase
LTHILVTNDDGVYASGLLALAKALKPLGKVSIVAPDHNWSVTGHTKTLHRPLRVKEVQLDELTALSTDGAPSDCVALAFMGLLPEPIDLVVSGINPAPNLGNDITYSGTVTAAMEGVIWGLKSVAISLNVGDRPNPPKIDYALAAQVGYTVCKKVLENGLPDGILLNVNVPSLPAENIKGYRISRQGMRIYKDFLVQREDPFGKPYYWIGGEIPGGIPEEGTDIGDLDAGYISITPIHLDMTAHAQLELLRTWDWS